MKTYCKGGRKTLRSLIPLDGGEWVASRTGRFTPGLRDPGTHWIGGSVGPGAGLDVVAKRKNPIITPAENWNSFFQPVSTDLNMVIFEESNVET